MRDAGWSISFSDTETLDYVFDTGSGGVTVNCSVAGAQVRVGPVPDNGALTLGILLAVLSGGAGIALLVAWITSGYSRTQPPSGPGRDNSESATANPALS